MSAARNRLLTTALDLFLHEGLQSVGIDRILKEANVSKMTLYKYFPSKEGLIEAVLRNYHQQIMQQLQTSVGPPAADMDSHLALLFGWYSRNFVEAPVRGCLFGTAALVYFEPAHPIHRVCIEHKQALLSLLSQLLSFYGFPHPNHLAMQCLLLVEGARNLFDIGIEGEPLQLALDAIRTLLKVAHGARVV
ncbi:TetR/AcrR family transcriptional regulator [Phytopseudomonas dryadis]|nr:TetR/AcrR family transcriptional regulator [Pseudomonas dryadis]